MAESRKEAEVKKEPEARKYIAKENCFFSGRYLSRGDVIILTEEPDHKCLVPYEGGPEKGDARYIDPVQEMIERRRVKAAIDSFMR